MAYLDYTRPDSSTPTNLTLCLTFDECKLLLPTISKAVKNARKMYEKYKDIQEGGEATEKQQDKYIRYEEELNILEAVEYLINEVTEKEEKK